MSTMFTQVLDGLLSDGEDFEKILFASDKGSPPNFSSQVDFPRLELILSGHYINEVWSPEGETQSIWMGQREAMYIPPNCWNKPNWDSDCSIVSVLFGKRRIGFSLVNKHKGDTGFSDVKKHNIHTGAGYVLDYILLSLNTLAQEQVKTPMDNYLLKALLSCLRQLLVESKHDQNHGFVLFREICIYIQENIHRSLCRECIAAHFNISPSHLSRLFRQQGNMRLIDYISMIRLERAIFMQRKYHFRLEEVANRCGFTDVNYFYRVFKQKTGLTPSQFRTLNRSQSAIIKIEGGQITVRQDSGAHLTTDTG
ncbi:helix-turn-helix transcriptional regulator [Aeromonas enteropelogenes]|uniref:helix-turn-helix transcriptional regulator n=1 Tax=Aeromonas enteropelogenes TaxID=29489 RepID=UPI0038D1E669